MNTSIVTGLIPHSRRKSIRIGVNRWWLMALGLLLAVLASPTAHATSEASLVLPDLKSVSFMGIGGRTLLMGGLIAGEPATLFVLPALYSLIVPNKKLSEPADVMPAVAH